MRQILLHICCGVCASSAVERLRDEGFKPLGFFYNPNIHPKKEYLKRYKIAKEIACIMKFDLIAGPYDKDRWLKKTIGLEDEAEGGGRCCECFKMRLEKTKRIASKMSISKFSTTLTLSPHKNTVIINEIGKKLSPLGFLARDFKKQDGFRLAIEFAKRYNLYRQGYCGCIYSLNARLDKKC